MVRRRAASSSAISCRVGYTWPAMPHETVSYRRGELYDLVWSQPVRVIAKKYGVSDVALAKMCRRLNVPVPGRGYWARVAAGQKPKRKSLAALKVGQPEEISVRRWRPIPKDETLNKAPNARTDEGQPI